VVSQYVDAALWIISIGTLVAILIGLQPLQNTEHPATQLANSFWLAFTRNNWGYSIAWIIFACHFGSGGIIKWILEMPCWQPLGRMSLSFYLVHMIYQTFEIAARRVPFYFSPRGFVSSHKLTLNATLTKSHCIPSSMTMPVTLSLRSSSLRYCI
jgi:peptidoglycan/LPS O-acetylase OafA/YrhL